MGACKQLLLLEGKTVIGRCLEALLAGGINEVIVVVGPNGDDVAREAHGYPVNVVRTVDPDGDMAASVRVGRDCLTPETTGVLIALCDHPLVAPETVALLVAHHHMKMNRIVIPIHNGRKGHPTLFPRALLDELQTNLTLRDLVRSDPDRLLPVDVNDHGVVLDMDTPEDYIRLTALCRVGMLSESAPRDSSEAPSA
jgi:molybdenum cofactor cytidylyltransferase